MKQNRQTVKEQTRRKWQIAHSDGRSPKSQRTMIQDFAQCRFNLRRFYLYICSHTHQKMLKFDGDIILTKIYVLTKLQHSLKYIKGDIKKSLKLNLD